MENIAELCQKKNSREKSAIQQMGQSLIKGTLIALAMSILSLCIYAILLANTNVQENTMPTVIIIVTAISLLAGSMIATRTLQSKGIITGALIGILYMGSMYILSSIMLSELTWSHSTIIMLMIGMIFSAIGGIVGVNLRK